MKEVIKSGRTKPKKSRNHSILSPEKHSLPNKSPESIRLRHLQHVTSLTLKHSLGVNLAFKFACGVISLLLILAIFSPIPYLAMHQDGALYRRSRNTQRRQAFPALQGFTEYPDIDYYLKMYLFNLGDFDSFSYYEFPILGFGEEIRISQEGVIAFSSQEKGGTVNFQILKLEQRADMSFEMETEKEAEGCLDAQKAVDALKNVCNGKSECRVKYEKSWFKSESCVQDLADKGYKMAIRIRAEPKDRYFFPDRKVVQSPTKEFNTALCVFYGFWFGILAVFSSICWTCSHNLKAEKSILYPQPNYFTAQLDNVFCIGTNNNERSFEILLIRDFIKKLFSSKEAKKFKKNRFGIQESEPKEANKWLGDELQEVKKAVEQEKIDRLERGKNEKIDLESGSTLLDLDLENEIVDIYLTKNLEVIICKGKIHFLRKRLFEDYELFKILCVSKNALIEDHLPERCTYMPNVKKKVEIFFKNKCKWIILFNQIW